MADRPLPAYDGDEPFVFVSYSHQDEELVYPELRWLQDQGINVWYDEGISGAARWRDAIAGRLTGCHLLLFYLSPTSVSSQVCREELEFALDAGGTTVPAEEDVDEFVFSGTGPFILNGSPASQATLIVDGN